MESPIHRLADSTNCSLKSLESNGQELSGLAHSFAATGNAMVAKILLRVVNDIYDNVDTIRGNESDMLDFRVAEATANTNTMLTAVLAGVAINDGPSHVQ